MIKDEAGRVVGARLRDRLHPKKGCTYNHSSSTASGQAEAGEADEMAEEGEEVIVHCRSVINAGGAFCDGVRTMDFSSGRGGGGSGDANDDPNKPLPQPAAAAVSRLMQPSSGVHIALPDFFSPDNMGLIVPKTADGRVVFLLPWLGYTIVGTTDTPCQLTSRPKPREEDIRYLLNTIRPYVSIKARRQDVLSAWSGIRPLVGAGGGSTENVTRSHLLLVDDTSKMVHTH